MARKIVTDPLDADVGDFCYRNRDDAEWPKGLHNWDTFPDTDSAGRWFVRTLGGQLWILLPSSGLWERKE